MVLKGYSIIDADSHVIEPAGMWAEYLEPEFKQFAPSAEMKIQGEILEMLVLDQTHLDIGLRVAKVIVPSMCHMWKRLVPGRLYQAQVKIGWLQEPLTEEQLNPFLMWM